MSTLLKNRKALAAVLIAVIAVSITGVTAYAWVNTQRSTQQNYVVALLFFKTGQMRIVSQAPSITEIVFGLGLEDYLVGCTEYCDYPPKLTELIAAGRVNNELSWWNPSTEAIVALSPTIVLLDSGVGAQVQIYNSLISQGIAAFLVSKGNSINEIETSILQLGSFFERSSKAQELVNAMETKIDTIEGNVSGQTKVDVLFCVWISFDQTYGGVYTCGNNTFLSEIVNKSGGLNVYYDSVDPWPFVTLADAASKNPDVIIISDHSALLDPNEIRTQMADSPLNTTDAYKNGDVYFTQQQADNLFMRAGPRVAEAVELLAHLLHPSLFGDTIPDWFVVNNTNYQDFLSSLILE